MSETLGPWRLGTSWPPRRAGSEKTGRFSSKVKTPLNQTLLSAYCVHEWVCARNRSRLEVDAREDSLFNGLQRWLIHQGISSSNNGKNSLKYQRREINFGRVENGSLRSPHCESENRLSLNSFVGACGLLRSTTNHGIAVRVQAFKGQIQICFKA